MTKEQFNQKLEQLRDYAKEFDYDVEVDGNVVLLISNCWVSSRIEYIKINFFTYSIMCYYTLICEDNKIRYPSYLPFADMKNITDILFGK